jgi:hypothetical protein
MELATPLLHPPRRGGGLRRGLNEAERLNGLNDLNAKLKA